MNGKWHGAALIALALTLPALGPARAGTWEAIERIPGRNGVEVVVDGKPRIYFRVTPDAPLEVPIDGAARLRLTSRAEFPAGHKEVVSYTVRVMEGAHEIEREDTESAPSDRVEGPSRGIGVGKSRRMTVDVPAGRHTLSIVVQGVPAAFVRLHVAAPERGAEPTVSLTPVQASRSVLVAEGEKTIPYYSVSAGKPVKLRVVGPVPLELLARLDFEPSMRGTQTYRLAVTEGGRRVREMEFKTTKATTASYTNLADRVPSKFDRVVVSLGAGTHELSIELLAPARGTAEIHARIPQPTVGGEE